MTANIESADRVGPTVLGSLSCSGCAHERTSRYAVQGDSGTDVFCALAQKTVGDTNWTTPQWCPVRPPDSVAAIHAAALEEAADSLRDIRVLNLRAGWTSTIDAAEARIRALATKEPDDG